MPLPRRSRLSLVNYISYAAGEANRPTNCCTEHNWYPELLNTLSVEVDQPPARNMAVFKSLVDRGVQGELALGTEKKVDVEFYDDDL